MFLDDCWEDGRTEPSCRPYNPVHGQQPLLNDWQRENFISYATINHVRNA